MSKIFSTEDNNLSQSIRVQRERKYSDLDLAFDARTTTDGDLYKKTDAAAVKQAVKNLLLTNRFEKPYRPDYGANLSSLLFELANEDVGEEIIEAVKGAIQRYEPRAKILDIKVTANLNTNAIAVTIQFRVINTNAVDVLRVNLNQPGSVLDVSIPFAGPPVFFDNRILAESLDRLLTESGLYIVREIGTIIDDAILTQDGDMLALTNDDGLVLIIQ
jgi:phage baseplate assembly protein W